MPTTPTPWDAIVRNGDNIPILVGPPETGPTDRHTICEFHPDTEHPDRALPDAALIADLPARLAQLRHAIKIGEDTGVISAYYAQILRDTLGDPV